MVENDWVLNSQNWNLLDLLESYWHPEQLGLHFISQLGNDEAASGMEGWSSIFQEAGPMVIDALFVLIT